MTKLNKVISGGQTGIDSLGLITAKANGIETGGTAPKGYRTENGNNINLKTEFGLLESFSYNYSIRTEDNVRDSNGTVLFGDLSSSGSKETKKIIKSHKKPSVENPTIEELIQFIEENNVNILNVAGNRASKLTDEDIKKYAKILNGTFEYFKSRNAD